MGVYEERGAMHWVRGFRLTKKIQNFLTKKKTPYIQKQKFEPIKCINILFHNNVPIL